jgi:hypothetical protein
MKVWRVIDTGRDRELAVYNTKALAKEHINRVLQHDPEDYDLEIGEMKVQVKVSNDIDDLIYG